MDRAGNSVCRACIGFGVEKMETRAEDVRFGICNRGSDLSGDHVHDAIAWLQSLQRAAGDASNNLPVHVGNCFGGE